MFKYLLVFKNMHANRCEDLAFFFARHTHDKLNLRLWTNQQNDIIDLIHRNFNIFQGLKEPYNCIYFALSGANKSICT